MNKNNNTPQNPALSNTAVISSQDIGKEAMDFVKNNCLTWCQLDWCHLRACEKPELKQKIINGGQIDCL